MNHSREIESNSGTMEERMVQRAQKKLFLDTMVNRGSTKSGEEMDKLNTSEMLKMLSFGMNAMFAPKSKGDQNETTFSFTDAQIDRLIDRKQIGSNFNTFGHEGDDDEDEEESNNDITIEEQRVNLEKFDENEDLVSLTAFEGQEYRDKEQHEKKRRRRFETINVDAIQTTKRKRKKRILTVDGFEILKSNMYSLEDGEPSVMDKELKADKMKKPKISSASFVPVSRREVAGRDYDYQAKCMVCFRNVASNNPKAFRCWQCPVVCHSACLSKISKENKHHITKQWNCTHHQCGVCNRKAAAAGGLLFRCEMCPKAWCEDDLPAYARDHITNRNSRYIELGMTHPKTACFVLCSRACVERSKRTNEGRLSDNEETEEEEEEEDDKSVDKSKKKKKKQSLTKQTRSDWDRLGMATSLSNNAVQWSLGIAMTTKSQGVPLRSIPGFENRLRSATDFAATRLHAILYVDFWMFE